MPNSEYKRQVQALRDAAQHAELTEAVNRQYEAQITRCAEKLQCSRELAKWTIYMEEELAALEKALYRLSNPNP